MSEDLRALNADQERRQVVPVVSYPTLMWVDVAAFGEDGAPTQFRGLHPGPYGLDADPI